MLAREVIHSNDAGSFEHPKAEDQISTQNQTTVDHQPNAWTDGGSVITCWHEMWCSEIYDGDLTSVGRIHACADPEEGWTGAPDPSP